MNAVPKRFNAVALAAAVVYIETAKRHAQSGDPKRLGFLKLALDTADDQLDEYLLSSLTEDQLKAVETAAQSIRDAGKEKGKGKDAGA